MKLQALGAWIALAALTGCASSPMPSTASRFDARPQRVGRDLLYVSYDGGVRVYTFPSLKMVGALGGDLGAQGICADAAGDIFVPFIYSNGGTNEYAHGRQEPIAYLGFSYSSPHACSVDPKTGNVAVVGGYPGNGAYVTVYHDTAHGGWKLGKSYEVAGLYIAEYCGYDRSSNLFCDGTTSRSGGFALAKLAAHASSFTRVNVAKQIVTPGQVQWDGRYLAIGDSSTAPSVVYQFDVQTDTATNVGQTTLKGSAQVEQFWIQGKTIIAPDAKRLCGSTLIGCVAVYSYPAGGSATAMLELYDAQGAAISLHP